MEKSLYFVNDKLVLNEKAKIWCRLPYPDHPHGCPNYGKKDICPPRAPDVREYFNFNGALKFLVVKFDFHYHVTRMQYRHPDWSDRQCRNLLYWQQSVVKELKKYVWDSFHTELQSHEQVVTYVPEAMGVDVFATCAKIGVPIERNPVKYIYKIALVGSPKRQPVVVGSGYIPYINKDEHEPETLAEMAMSGDDE